MHTRLFPLAVMLMCTITLCVAGNDLSDDEDDKDTTKRVKIAIQGTYKVGAISPDGKLIAMLASKGSKTDVQLWTTEGKTAGNFSIKDTMSRLYFSDDNRTLTVTGDGKMAQVIELKTGVMTASNTPTPALTSEKEVLRSPDGKYVVEMTGCTFPVKISGEKDYEFSPKEEYMKTYDVRNVRVHIVNGKVLLWAADAYPKTGGKDDRSPDLPCGYLRGLHCMHCGKGGSTMYTSFERLIAMRMLPDGSLMTLVEHQQYKTHELTISVGK